ncbi:MAG TPA: hypothetical protein VEF55_06335 [Candidatus Binatia bacterium]|nr:hypothetical protein [Candidatus Binatia bacterium]
MRALPNRFVIEVKFTRLTLVSQWPVLLHDWVDRDGWCDDPAKDLQMGLRLLAALFLQLAGMFVLICGVTITAHELGSIVFFLIWALCAALCLSFQLSYDRGRPVGLFWLIQRLERPTKLRQASDGG